MMPSQRPSTSLMILCVFFVFTGILHFVKPEMYMKIMPPWLPAPMALILISGVFEILGGIGVIPPATRSYAGWGLIALLVAVFPANIQMLLDALRTHASNTFVAISIARLPFQPLLIWWVYKSAVLPGR